MQYPQSTATEEAEAPADSAAPKIELTRTHRALIGIVIAGAVVIAAIGFAGSYAAVRQLAQQKGFGWFANVFPIGIDAGIVVLLALDLLLTWLRIPFPLLRQTAWVLTAATIAFNAAAAWPDPLGVGMHAVIPILFVVSVEAARHAVGRIADITADRHMESVRIARWLLAPLPTFLLWRRMKLWELRSYDEVVRLEQARMVYRARLRAKFGRGWRRKAPVEFVMPLRLARYGVALDAEQLAEQLAEMAQPVSLADDIHSSQSARHEIEAGSPVSGYTDESTYPLAAGGRFPTPGPAGASYPDGDTEGGESLQDGTASASPDQVDTYNEPEAASRETVMADRSRQPADTIHVRIPAQQDTDEDPDEAKDQAEEAEVIDLTTMPGVEAVQLAYERLSPEERKQSDRQKATKIADMTGLAYNTVRRYLSDLRKAQREEVSSAAPEVAPVPEPEGGWAILPPDGGGGEGRPATDQDPEVSTEEDEWAEAFTRHHQQGK
ncbi:DUF2637 domain-containing protein [Streptomyces sp. MBT53]|uniref:DUF2637 domain-containing protein n=1 Tax=Streptomyces sp. MBT53 TaxID=1488384 RepID=UPI001F3B4A87|nr:DUF2637 domain-containing protein [Streptomyces sp. MBT53]